MQEKEGGNEEKESTKQKQREEKRAEGNQRSHEMEQYDYKVINLLLWRERRGEAACRASKNNDEASASKWQTHRRAS